MTHLAASPATDRLGRILDGLNDAPGWGGDAAGVLAPGLAALMPLDLFAERVRQRAAVFAPLAVIGLDASDHAARARVCTCSDPRVHQARLEGRARGIPGWHEGGHWPNVERRLAAFPPWTGDVLTVDAVRPLADNLKAVLGYVAS